MENNVQKSNTGLIVLIIILVIAVIGLGGFIAYDKVINSKSEVKEADVEEIEETKEEDKATYNYSTVKGVYTFEGEQDANGDADRYTISLSENGLYHYEAYKYAEAGQIGNYTIVGDEIHLNQIFLHGSDAALSVESGTKVLKINSEEEIIDNNPEKLSDKEYSQISLKKDSTKEITDFNNCFQNYGIFNNERQK